MAAVHCSLAVLTMSVGNISLAVPIYATELTFAESVNATPRIVAARNGTWPTGAANESIAAAAPDATTRRALFAETPLDSESALAFVPIGRASPVSWRAEVWDAAGRSSSHLAATSTYEGRETNQGAQASSSIHNSIHDSIATSTAPNVCLSGTDTSPGDAASNWYSRKGDQSPTES